MPFRSLRRMASVLRWSGPQCRSHALSKSVVPTPHPRACAYTHSRMWLVSIHLYILVFVLFCFPCIIHVAVDTDTVHLPASIRCYRGSVASAQAVTMLHLKPFNPFLSLPCAGRLFRTPWAALCQTLHPPAAVCISEVPRVSVSRILHASSLCPSCSCCHIFAQLSHSRRLPVLAHTLQSPSLPHGSEVCWQTSQLWRWFSRHPSSKNVQIAENRGFDDRHCFAIWFCGALCPRHLFGYPIDPFRLGCQCCGYSCV